ncbi:tRNA (guanosine(46)-N7)-methyltransferase TrmB [Mycoplasma bradburyae]|uniref:tRNA (guanine-N(7)-)-methyltransferase n=1 Tax=Mycoplasma bradburyae TaxID=2963128 RepID=A0AAW6HNK4_9MOLU|nr:tRNA (guanosine(46)-N7)-methyltransferase TrmB [Mycoplasma bradburyae]MDC4163356.1 tRNA (guanosine(46)-N7)-methyltransferase TrmB [Mycoplasma bradburyae]MDC4181970.1 tRNA (guanosine(46)-N7)-methyltransferase TrmB [Mycoplasma bradburyae]MDC4182673.1 tRNA (guanosine(46)-N7)-methyltransferase TrmB [Mycoplasma bradburyae]MDC4183345.1 tRNA (guanosine(46)-N7)-methyltransferase TrmB [Mycoplasma bradburyae]MDC4184153.1 tRNA (guanosine(46)-N7)-methyltransferase TrmB [Mycoplasma bradburyae]
MRIRNIKDANLKITKVRNTIKIEQLIDILDFNKNNVLEIGSGKGGFIYQKALNNPDINYLGIEKNATVILKMINKFSDIENLQNLSILNGDFAIIQENIPEQIFSKIYLNFSDPWPKKRHAKKRLVDLEFLMKYKRILKPDGVIEFKTDNDGLFEYAIETIQSNDQIKIIALTRDLHSLDENDDLIKDNVITEYEQRFINLNKNINKVVFKFI